MPVPIPTNGTICLGTADSLSWAMPWRRKPATYLEYWNGPVNRNAGFRTVIVYCLGAQNGTSCHHSGHLKLADLPDWDWYDISAHLKCTKCGTVGYVDTRVNWSEVVDFNKGLTSRADPVEVRWRNSLKPGTNRQRQF